MRRLKAQRSGRKPPNHTEQQDHEGDKREHAPSKRADEHRERRHAYRRQRHEQRPGRAYTWPTPMPSASIA